MKDEVLGPDFWVDIKTKSPKAHAAFLLWINEYKTAVYWQHLFKDTTIGLKNNTAKFHDLPGAMQFGIVLKFAVEHHIGTDVYFNAAIEIRDIFEVLENLISA